MRPPGLSNAACPYHSPHRRAALTVSSVHIPARRVVQQEDLEQDEAVAAMKLHDDVPPRRMPGRRDRGPVPNYADY